MKSIETTCTEPEQFLRLAAVMRMTGISRTGIFNKNKLNGKYYDPDFPMRVRISKRAVAWRLSELLTWIATRDIVRP